MKKYFSKVTQNFKDLWGGLYTIFSKNSNAPILVCKWIKNESIIRWGYRGKKLRYCCVQVKNKCAVW